MLIITYDDNKIFFFFFDISFKKKVYCQIKRITNEISLIALQYPPPSHVATFLPSSALCHLPCTAVARLLPISA